MAKHPKYPRPSDISQEDWDKLTFDDLLFINNFKEGVPFAKEIISQCKYSTMKEEMLRYNDFLEQIEYYNDRVFLFAHYVDTIKSWYE